MSELLTKDELMALPSGTRIRVFWSGAREEFEYILVFVGKGSLPYAAMEWEVEQGRFPGQRILSYLGKRPLTEVRLASPPTT